VLGNGSLMADEAVTFAHNVAQRNEADDGWRSVGGGALFVESDGNTIRFRTAAFESNRVNAFSGAGFGGAVALLAGHVLLLDGCQLHRNTVQMLSRFAQHATAGGIAVLSGASLTIAGGVLSLNDAGGIGRLESFGGFAADVARNLQRRAQYFYVSGSCAVANGWRDPRRGWFEYLRDNRRGRQLAARVVSKSRGADAAHRNQGACPRVRCP
jgi:hypothetical protein